MPRFSPKRAEAFAAYAITALVRDAKADGKTFVRISRQQFSEALELERLHESHIAEVRGHLIRFGYGMADLGAEFMFFEADQKSKTKGFTNREINHVTAAFLRVLGSDAADELWAQDKSNYMPAPRLRVRHRRDESGEIIRVR